VERWQSKTVQTKKFKVVKFARYMKQATVNDTITNSLKILKGEL
jgi:hypothetical protein